MTNAVKTLIIAAALAAVGAVSASESPRLYAVVDYMRVAQGQREADYIALEKLWSRLHQKAVDTGICRGWYFSRVENGGRDQFVTVRIYDALGKTAQPWSDELARSLYSEPERATMEKTETIRHLTRSELWEVQAAAMKEGQPDDPPYVVLHFMKAAPGKVGAYYELERGLFQKIHQARVHKGDLRAWYFISRTFPSGYDADYDFVTMNLYADKAASEKNWGRSTVDSALSSQEWEKAGTILATRELVREEIWRPILKVEPAK